MNQQQLYETKDLHLISYLDLKGFSYSMKKNGNEGIAVFTGDVKEIKKSVSDYFNDEGSFLSFSNKVRNVKSKIRNTTV